MGVLSRFAASTATPAPSFSLQLRDATRRAYDLVDRQRYPRARAVRTTPQRAALFYRAAISCWREVCSHRCYSRLCMDLPILAPPPFCHMFRVALALRMFSMVCKPALLRLYWRLPRGLPSPPTRIRLTCAAACLPALGSRAGGAARVACNRCG